MALSSCVSAVLCGLSGPVRGAVAAALTSVQALAYAQIAALEAAAAALQVDLLAIRASAAVLQAALDEARAVAGLLPVIVINGCAELGEVNLNMVGFTEEFFADVQAVVDKLNRYKSGLAIIQAKIAKLNAYVAKLDEVIAAINACGAPP